MPIDSVGHWYPELSAKQASLRERKERFLLVNGPRKSGKTVAVANHLCRRAWEFESTTSVICATVSAAVDQGVWELLTGSVVSQWVEGDFGFEWVREPYKEASTQKHKFKIRNRHGTVSTFQLDSLSEEKKVELKFKGRGVQTVWLSELSNFKHRATFDALIEFLRLPPGAKGMTKDDLQMICDTNPSDEGEDSWIYKLWYALRTSDIPPGHRDCALKENLGLVEFEIADNPYLSRQELELLYAQYGHNRNLSDRYLHGRWVKAQSEGLFASLWNPELHVVGEMPINDSEMSQCLLPESNCSELNSGFDLGQRNHACVMGETWPAMVPRTLVHPNGVEEVIVEEKMCFKVLDELIFLQEKVKVEDFVDVLMEKRRFWEAQCSGTVRWMDFSDKSAWRFDAHADKYEHEIVYAASGGKIQLIPFQNVSFTVAPCIRLIRRLLFENRILVNKAKCPVTVQMFESLPQGKAGDQSVKLDAELKHAFDALRYWICSKAMDEIQQAAFRPRFDEPISHGPVMISL